MKYNSFNDWTPIRLKYLATINDETLPENTNSDFEIDYLDIGNVNSNGVVEPPITYRFKDAPSRARRKVKNGDVIISTVRTYLQAIASIENPPENLIVSTGFAVIRPLPGKLDVGFCKYALREASFLSEVIMRSVGVSYPAINSSDLGNIFIKAPIVTIQSQIAAFLDHETERIDTLIAAKQRLLSLLAEKRQAFITLSIIRGIDPSVKMKKIGVNWLQEIPENWSMVRVKHITNKIGSGVTPKGGSEVYLREGIPFLRSQNIHFSGLQIDDLVYISEGLHQSMFNSKVKSGDVLLNITGASIGRCYYYEGQFQEANVNQHVCIVRPNRKVCTKYLYYLFTSDLGQMQVALYQTGGGREGLNFEIIKSFVFPLPSPEEQAQIIMKIENETNKITALKINTERSLTLLKERRSALISAAVTGQLEIKKYEN